ncbi:MAG: hypothetical protein KKF27_20370, partial [Gammaproteobacteria bacterium]|nr:hypothetical protein [Gammaproteobacteria bacterium]
DPIEEELDAEKTKKVKEAITEADSVLALLKEAETVKTEDGVKFPAEAFAYAPDNETPSEWKLRLWEDPTKKVTRKQLGAAAAALSPGGFRGQKVDIPAEALPSVKRKIRSAYRSLDVPDEEIPRWVKEAERRTILADYVSLSEAVVSGKGIATIVVIKPGLNSSKERYYAPEVLKRDAGLFEGVKMYADHPTPTEEREKPERSVKDWVATLKNVHVDDKGQIVGEAVVVEPWLQAKLAELRDKGMLQEMGISINAVGTASKGEIDGVKTNVIEKIVRVRSVDFVTEAGAGGMVTMYEVDRENDVDLVSIETLKERRPDLVKQIETAIIAGIQTEVKRKVELDEKVKELEANIETLTKERDELKGKITEAEKAKAKAEAQAVIKEAVSKAELPDAAKAKLTEQFKEAETADGIAEAIKAEAEYIAKLTEAGKVKGMGGSQPDEAKGKEALKESFKRAYPEWTDAQLETAVNGR